MTDWGIGMSADCTAQPIICWCGQSLLKKYHGTFLCGYCAMVENTGAWYTMVHGIPRYNMCHAIPCTMVYHGTFYHGKKVPPQNTMYHGIFGRYFLPQYTMVYHVPWYSGAVLFTMVYHGIPCTMVYHGKKYRPKISW